jgi:hypothetical protein
MWTAASAAPPVEFDGRFYEFVPASGISWVAANAAANAKTYLGVHGHLATINTPAEHQFIDLELRKYLPASSNRAAAWLGGYQENCSAEPGCGWKWVNGERIPGVNDLTGPFWAEEPYGFWQTGQPDNRQRAKYLAHGLNGVFGWSDEDNGTGMGGYFVEYGDKLVNFRVEDCAAVVGGQPGPGCDLTGALTGVLRGSILRWPASAVYTQGEPVGVSTYVINDIPGRCSGGQATPPGPLEVRLGSEVAGYIPNYLCAPLGYFLAIRTFSPVQIPSGVVAITNDTPNVLPAYPYDCRAPIPAGVDPLHQDVVVYQYDDYSDMLESAFPPGTADPTYIGTATESSNACGTTRGTGGKGSWIFIGLAIYPGLDSSYARLVNLIKFKLEVLAYGLDQAALEGAIANGDYNKMKNQVTNARGELSNGNLHEAAVHLGNFLEFKDAAVIQGEGSASSVTRNWDGEFQMRATNIEFLLEVRAEAAAP